MALFQKFNKFLTFDTIRRNLGTQTFLMSNWKFIVNFPHNQLSHNRVKTFLESYLNFPTDKSNKICIINCLNSMSVCFSCHECPCSFLNLLTKWNPDNSVTLKSSGSMVCDCLLTFKYCKTSNQIYLAFNYSKNERFSP